MLTRLLAASLVLHSACYAPQRSGAARTTYMTIATADGGMLGGVAGAVGCGFVTGDIWKHGGDGSKVPLLCGLAGMVTGGAGALLGSLDSDDEPDRATWVVVSLPAAALGVSVVVGGITWVIDQLRH